MLCNALIEVIPNLCHRQDLRITDNRLHLELGHVKVTSTRYGEIGFEIIDAIV